MTNLQHLGIRWASTRGSSGLVTASSDAASPVCWSRNVVVWVGSTAQAKAEEDAEAANQEETQEDVEQGGGPEGKQVEGLVAVGFSTC